MPPQKNASAHTSNKNPLVIMAIVLIVAGVGWYCWSTYNRYHKGIPEHQTPLPQALQQNPAKSPMQNSAIPSPRQRRELLARLLDELNLTKKQKQQLLKLGPPKGPEDFPRRREHLQKILTPEQMKRFQNLTRAHVGRQMNNEMNRALKHLGPKAQEAFLRRVQKRMESRGAFRQEQNNRNAPR